LHEKCLYHLCAILLYFEGPFSLQQQICIYLFLLLSPLGLTIQLLHVSHKLLSLISTSHIPSSQSFWIPSHFPTKPLLLFHAHSSHVNFLFKFISHSLFFQQFYVKLNYTFSWCHQILYHQKTIKSKVTFSFIIFPF